jgi:hypothetical protein
LCKLADDAGDGQCEVRGCSADDGGFFELLQQFARLGALKISRYHLWHLLVAAKVKLRLNVDLCLVVDEDEDEEGEEERDGRGRKTKRELGLLFPVMRRMQV